MKSIPSVDTCKLRQEIGEVTLEELLCIIYNSGYKAGHHYTVEGGYTDVVYRDYGEYHREEVMEIIEEYGFGSILG